MYEEFFWGGWSLLWFLAFRSNAHEWFVAGLYLWTYGLWTSDSLWYGNAVLISLSSPGSSLWTSSYCSHVSWGYCSLSSLSFLGYQIMCLWKEVGTSCSVFPWNGKGVLWDGLWKVRLVAFFLFFLFLIRFFGIRLMGCGFHHCERLCHSDECGNCSAPCGKTRKSWCVPSWTNFTKTKWLVLKRFNLVYLISILVLVLVMRLPLVPKPSPANHSLH